MGRFEWAFFQKQPLSNGVPTMARHLTLEEREVVSQMHHGVGKQVETAGRGKTVSELGHQTRFLPRRHGVQSDLATRPCVPEAPPDKNYPPVHPRPF